MPRVVGIDFFQGQETRRRCQGLAGGNVLIVVEVEKPSRRQHHIQPLFDGRFHIFSTRPAHRRRSGRQIISLNLVYPTHGLAARLLQIARHRFSQPAAQFFLLHPFATLRNISATDVDPLAGEEFQNFLKDRLVECREFLFARLFECGIGLERRDGAGRDSNLWNNLDIPMLGIANDLRRLLAGIEFG